MSRQVVTVVDQVSKRLYLCPSCGDLHPGRSLERVGVKPGQPYGVRLVPAPPVGGVPITDVEYFCLRPDCQGATLVRFAPLPGEVAS